MSLRVAWARASKAAWRHTFLRSFLTVLVAVHPPSAAEVRVFLPSLLAELSLNFAEFLAALACNAPALGAQLGSRFRPVLRHDCAVSFVWVACLCGLACCFLVFTLAFVEV